MLLIPDEQRACAAAIVLYCMNFVEGITCIKWLAARDVIFEARFCEQTEQIQIIN